LLSQNSISLADTEVSAYHMKNIKWLILIAIFVFGFAYRALYVSPSKDNNPIFFQIAKNETFGTIVSDLKEKGLVKNEALIKLYARTFGIDKKIKAGRFRLDSNLSPVATLNFLVDPEHGEISITIPEGSSIFDIDAKLTALSIIQKNDFINWAINASTQDFPFIPNNGNVPRTEGYLFPDTYFIFAKNFRPEDLGNAMLRNFDKKVVEGLTEDIKNSKRSLNEIIIMASILEREVQTEEDCAVVAGMLWKRLDNKWPLQVDATLLYGKADRSILSGDLQRDGSHNTYTRQGLPATPIGNPGLKTIRAAIHPVDSPYWFYLNAKDGKTIYAKTNKEHAENKIKFL